MGDEYQLRRDIDKLYGKTYDFENNSWDIYTKEEIGENYYDKGEIDEILIGSTNDLIDKVYPVGSIYMSVNNASPQTLFGGTWVQLQDTFLYATSTTADDNVTTAPTGQGEATHSLTQSEMPRHTHTQNSHSHKPSNTALKFMTTKDNISINGDSRAWASKVSSGGTHYAYSNDTNGINEETNTQSVTATNKYTGGSGTSESASNGVAHNNMPPYMKVFMWKRTQ